MTQSLDLFALPCSFCKCRFHTASDCYHLHGALPISNPQWLGHHQMDNQYPNTSNYGWSYEPSFRQEEGNNYGFSYYQRESPSPYEMPTSLYLTTPIQQQSRSDEHQAFLDELKESISRYDHLLQLALCLDEQQVEKDDASLEEDSEDGGNTIIIDDIPFVTSSFSCDTGQHIIDEDHVKQDEIEKHDSNTLASNESSNCLHDLDCCCDECNNESHANFGIFVQWLIKNQSISGTAEIPKETMVLEEEEEEEEEEEKEFVDPPPLIIQQQLEIEKPPLFTDFVIPFHSISTSHFIFDFISLCGVGVKEIIFEEHADQRVGSIICSLQRRSLLPLWIFKENLKPD